MNDFKIELLEFLINNPGQTIDIRLLAEKYCGIESYFDLEEQQQKVRCRQSINEVLIDLAKTNWIALNPSSGLSTGTGHNASMNKRYFLLDNPVQVRLTTKGEMEYKQLRKIDEPKGHTFNISEVSGNIMIATDHANQTTAFEKKSSENITPKENKFVKALVKIMTWLWDNVIKILVSVIAGYILYKMGWKK